MGNDSLNTGQTFIRTSTCIASRAAVATVSFNLTVRNRPHETISYHSATVLECSRFKQSLHIIFFCFVAVVVGSVGVGVSVSVFHKALGLLWERFVYLSSTALDSSPIQSNQIHSISFQFNPLKSSPFFLLEFSHSLDGPSLASHSLNTIDRTQRINRINII
jgi:hypothetical protein